MNKPYFITPRVLIVEDHEPMRELLKMTLAGVADVVGECCDGADTLAAYREFLPDWVLMDYEMKRMDGLTAARSILQAFPVAKILMVTQYTDTKLQAAASEAGARGFVSKDDLLALHPFLSDDAQSH